MSVQHLNNGISTARRAWVHQTGLDLTSTFQRNLGRSIDGKPMALNAEFKKHLHELMIEVADKTRDEEVAYANQLKGQAIATHNSSAFPIAIRDAKLHSIENRVGQTIAKYIEAVSIWGLTVDDTLERDMIKEFWSLTAAPNQLQFPPAINHSSHAQAVNRSYSMELQRLQNRLVREGTNRLRELKMKMKAKPQSDHSTIIQGDQYINNGIAGAIGPHSVGTINIQQQWTAIQNEVDLNALTSELEQLKRHLQQSASSSFDYQTLALLSEAEEHTKKHDGSKAMEVLSKVGKGALDVAKDIGTEIVAKVIAKSMGLEP
jgi:hypothetical protein